MKFFFRRKDDPYPHQQGKEHHITLTERDFFWLDENDASLHWHPIHPLLRKLKSVSVQLPEGNNMSYE